MSACKRGMYGVCHFVVAVVANSRSKAVSPWPKFSKLPFRSSRDDEDELEDTTKLATAKANTVVDFSKAKTSNEHEGDLDQSTLRVNYVDDGVKGFGGEFALTDDDASYSEDDLESIDVPMPIVHHHVRYF